MIFRSNGHQHRYRKRKGAHQRIENPLAHNIDKSWPVQPGYNFIIQGMRPESLSAVQGALTLKKTRRSCTETGGTDSFKNTYKIPYLLFRSRDTYNIVWLAALPPVWLVSEQIGKEDLIIHSLDHHRRPKVSPSSSSPSPLPPAALFSFFFPIPLSSPNLHSSSSLPSFFPSLRSSLNSGASFLLPKLRPLHHHN